MFCFDLSRLHLGEDALFSICVETIKLGQENNFCPRVYGMIARIQIQPGKKAVEQIIEKQVERY